MRIKPAVFAYLLAVLSLSMLLIGSTMVAGPDVQPAATKKTLSIPAAAFNEVGYAPDWNIQRTGGYLLSLPTGAFHTNIGHFHAPVILPDNFKIYGVRFYSKNPDTPPIVLMLIRNTPSGGTNVETTIATVQNPSFSGANFVLRSVALRAPHTVKNAGASYSLHLYLPDGGDGVAFHHAEIVYSGKKW